MTIRWHEVHLYTLGHCINLEDKFSNTALTQVSPYVQLYLGGTIPGSNLSPTEVRLKRKNYFHRTNSGYPVYESGILYKVQITKHAARMHSGRNYTRVSTHIRRVQNYFG